MEGSVPVVNACIDEVGENIVRVGGTDQLVYGKPHLLRVVRGENVAEVACRNDDVDLLAVLYVAALYE